MDDVVGRGTLLAGRYRTLQPIASDLPGATSWEASDQILDRPVRVTILRDGDVPQALDAARRAALVTDPRLVRVLDVGEHEGVAYTVTEQVTGPSLADLVARGPLPADQARAVIGEAAAALEAARRRGVHHLALRPSVLHLTPDDRVLVTGLAVDGALLGREARSADAASRTDTVALVALLYAALTGRWPASVPTVPAERAQSGSRLAPAPVLQGAPVAPGELSSAVPNDLDTLCAVTLGVHDDGPQSPAELVQELEPWGDIRSTDLFAATQALPVTPAAARTTPVPAVPAPPSGPAQVQRTSVRSAFAAQPGTPPRPGTPPPAVPTRSSAFGGPAVGQAPVTHGPGPVAAAAAPTAPLPRTDPARPAASSDGNGRPAPTAPTARPGEQAAAATIPLGTPAPAGGAPREHRPAGAAPTTPTSRPTPPGAAEARAPHAGTASSGAPAATSTPAQAPAPGPVRQAQPPAARPARPTQATAPAPARQAPRPTTPAPTAPAVPSPAPAPAAPERTTTPAPAPVATTGRPSFLPFPTEGELPGARETIAAHRFDPTRLVLLLVVVAIVVGLVVAYRSLTRPVDLTVDSPAAEATQSAPAEVAPPAAEGAQEPPAEDPAATTAPVIASAAQLDPPPGGDENEHPEAVPLAIDGDPATTWFTRTYNRPDFGGLKPGVGYAVTLARPATVTTVTLQVQGTGGRVEVRATDPTTPTEGTVLAEGTLGAQTVLTLAEPTETQHVVLWFTELPQAADGANRLELAEVTVS